MNEIKLKAEKRELEGRKVKKLRRDGLLPANIFGRGVKSQSIQVNLKEFGQVFQKAGETNLVEVGLGKETRPVLIHNVQLDPITDQVLHVDFLQVDLKKKVTAEVPVELVGVSPAEKQSLGTVVQYVNEIKVEALPTEIPDKFEIDISVLSEVDQMVQIKDLKIDASKVKIEGDPEQLVVKVEPPKAEKEEVAPVAPAEGEEVATGEAPIEGESQKEEAPNEPTKE